MAFGMDAAFTEDAFVTRFNADLSNGLGNLVSRVLAMQHKYFDGVVQPIGDDLEPADEALRDAFVTAEQRAKELIERLAFHTALEEIWKALAACDKYVVDEAPFKKWKQDDLKPRVGAILHVLCDALAHAARLIAPFMPDTADRISALIGIDTSKLGEPSPAWFDSFENAHRLAAPEPLFPRLDVGKAE
jgi:methionyl-tRNA synthetase